MTALNLLLTRIWVTSVRWIWRESEIKQFMRV
jgi:hypothetical protein